MQLFRNSCIYLLLWVGLLITSSANAANLIIAVDESDWKPMSWVENGHVQGFEVELIHKTMEAISHNVTWRPLPWARLMLEVENGSVDAAIGLIHTTERESFLYYPNEATYQILPIIVGNQMTQLTQVFEPGNKDPILSTLGYFYGEPTDSLIKDRRVDVISQHNILKMLKIGRANYGILNVSLINDQPMWSGLSNFEYITTPVKQRHIFIAFSRNAARV